MEYCWDKQRFEKSEKMKYEPIFFYQAENTRLVNKNNKETNLLH